MVLTCIRSFLPGLGRANDVSQAWILVVDDLATIVGDELCHASLVPILAEVTRDGDSQLLKGLLHHTEELRNLFNAVAEAETGMALNEPCLREVTLGLAKLSAGT